MVSSSSILKKTSNPKDGQILKLDSLPGYSIKYQSQALTARTAFSDDPKEDQENNENKYGFFLFNLKGKREKKTRSCLLGTSSLSTAYSRAHLRRSLTATCCTQTPTTPSGVRLRSLLIQRRSVTWSVLRSWRSSSSTCWSTRSERSSLQRLYDACSLPTA